MVRPKWERPVLLVLVRSKSGESVLALCKTMDERIGNDGPASMFHSHCYVPCSDRLTCDRNRYVGSTWIEGCNHCHNYAGS